MTADLLSHRLGEPLQLPAVPPLRLLHTPTISKEKMQREFTHTGTIIASKNKNAFIKLYAVKFM